MEQVGELRCTLGVTNWVNLGTNDHAKNLGQFALSIKLKDVRKYHLGQGSFNSLVIDYQGWSWSTPKTNWFKQKNQWAKSLSFAVVGLLKVHLKSFKQPVKHPQVRTKPHRT